MYTFFNFTPEHIMNTCTLSNLNVEYDCIFCIYQHVDKFMSMPKKMEKIIERDYRKKIMYTLKLTNM